MGSEQVRTTLEQACLAIAVRTWSTCVLALRYALTSRALKWCSVRGCLAVHNTRGALAYRILISMNMRCVSCSISGPRLA
jgi:hypothetical protein